MSCRPTGWRRCPTSSTGYSPAARAWPTSAAVKAGRRSHCARAFPAADVDGLDLDDASISEARRHSAEAGGPAYDSFLYFRYGMPVDVSLDNVANDAAAGERDQVRSNGENLMGGSAGDTLRSFGAFSRLDGGGGVDTLDGGSSPDTLDGGSGRHTLDGGSGNDLLAARDGELDDVECGTETDSATIDNGERTLRNCETLNIGGLGLTPTATRAKAGETARPAIRVDQSLAGQAPTAEVEATDRRGARQLEPDAATVRVAR